MAVRLQAEMDYRALADLRYEIRRFLNFSEMAARAAGLEPQQHQALLAIKGLPPGRRPTVGVLAERLQLQHHSAVELAGRLQVKSLLRRRRDAVDRREVLLALTSRGEKVLKELSLTHHAELRSAGPTLLRALESVIRSSRVPRPTSIKSSVRRSVKGSVRSAAHRRKRV